MQLMIILKAMCNTTTHQEDMELHCFFIFPWGRGLGCSVDKILSSTLQTLIMTMYYLIFSKKISFLLCPTRIEAK